MGQSVRTVLFDLDGVLTDTAEYHYRAWKRLAGELGILLTREDNERLRGVSRRGSLEIILGLGNRTCEEPEMERLMNRKNDYYRAMLTEVTPDDLLPGVGRLLGELRDRHIKIVVASASRNSPEVVRRLGIEGRIDALAHGGMVTRQKPYPDLFFHAARMVGTDPRMCVVVEDAAAGIEAAIAAGMASVGIGPAERVGAADLVVPSLEGVHADDILEAARRHLRR